LFFKVFLEYHNENPIDKADSAFNNPQMATI